MVELARWHAAQRYERAYWESQAAQIATGSLARMDWYKWRAEQLAKRLRGVGRDTLTRSDARVVEIGSGPVGVVAYFPASHRVAVDPLASSYAENTVLTALRPSDVQYLSGTGEDLPCPSRSYDLVIMENCIDHVRDVAAVMREIARVLRPEGVLYLTVNCRTAWGFVLHRCLSRLRLDAGHPHTFTASRARALVTRATAFRLLQLEAESPWEARRADLRSTDLRARVKGILGVSEFVVTILAQRVPDA